MESEPAGVSLAKSLYEEIGGAPAIAAATERFYEHVLADHELAPSFDGVDMDRLKRLQKQFLALATGGPDEYEGRSMEEAHRNLLITMHQFDRVASHLKNTLIELGLRPVHVKGVLDAVEGTRDDIVTVYESEAADTANEGEAPMAVTQSPAPPLNHLDGGLGRKESPDTFFKAMLDNAPTNVILADKDLNITYLNPASLSVLKSLEQYLPVPADKVLGSNIDIFHANPAHQRKLLSNPRNLPHRAVIEIGPEKADLLVSAIYGTDGEYIGPMVTWEVVTDRLRLESEQARIQSMVENVPINIIMADLDFNITYLNPASTRTLQSIEQHLPMKVKDILGSNIDSFHKNPSVQRKLLTDPNNLPHEAVIQIGPEQARLLVNAIYDNNNKYIGPMVTWEIITERLHIENQIAETSQALASSSEEMTAVATQMSSNAEETSAQANVVAAAAEQVSKNIETVATSAEEMSASIKEISSNTTTAAKVAHDAVKVAETTNTIMSKLDASSTEIGQVIKVITSIAQQTNLLALNATIEAARAGEAGKGFAVVANEVKELAKQTAQATEDIGQKIETIQTDTRGAVDAIAQISQIIDKINDIQNTIAGAVEEQTATTNEIGRNVAEAAKGAAEIAENIAGVAQAAQSTSQGATEARTSSGELAKLASDLKGLLNRNGK